MTIGSRPEGLLNYVSTLTEERSQNPGSAGKYAVINVSSDNLDRVFFADILGSTQHLRDESKEKELYMGLESQISDLQETLESLFNHGVPSSLLDKLRRVTTPREEELAATIVQSANQSLKQ